jgi:hypothetical protein
MGNGTGREMGQKNVPGWESGSTGGSTSQGGLGREFLFPIWEYQWEYQSGGGLGWEFPFSIWEYYVLKIEKIRIFITLLGKKYRNS